MKPEENRAFLRGTHQYIENIVLQQPGVRRFQLQKALSCHPYDFSGDLTPFLVCLIVTAALLVPRVYATAGSHAFSLTYLIRRGSAWVAGRLAASLISIAADSTFVNLIVRIEPLRAAERTRWIIVAACGEWTAPTRAIGMRPDVRLLSTLPSAIRVDGKKSSRSSSSVYLCPVVVSKKGNASQD